MAWNGFRPALVLEDRTTTTDNSELLTAARCRTIDVSFDGTTRTAGETWAVAGQRETKFLIWRRPNVVPAHHLEVKIRIASGADAAAIAMGCRPQYIPILEMKDRFLFDWFVAERLRAIKEAAGIWLSPKGFAVGLTDSEVPGKHRDHAEAALPTRGISIYFCPGPLPFPTADANLTGRA
jgi:hypothetical protein